MADTEAFDGTTFLGLARGAKRDPYRLSLFGQHLQPGETSRALLAVSGGTLIITDRRILLMRAHLDDHGAWNVKQFQGYSVDRSIDIGSVRDLGHSVQAIAERSGNRRIEDWLLVTTTEGREDILVPEDPTRPSPRRTSRSCARRSRAISRSSPRYHRCAEGVPAPARTPGSRSRPVEGLSALSRASPS